MKTRITKLLGTCIIPTSAFGRDQCTSKTVIEVRTTSQKLNVSGLDIFSSRHKVIITSF